MRRNGILSAVLLAGCLVLGMPWTFAAKPMSVPELRSRVTDLTGTLSTEEAAQLESVVAALLFGPACCNQAGSILDETSTGKHSPCK